MPRQLYPQYPLDRRLGGPYSQSECSGIEKKLPLLENEPPVVQPNNLSFYKRYIETLIK
jgi:hypothetical protein